MVSPYDPPPYLARMQQLGYPPGHLGDPAAPEAEEAPLQMYEGGRAPPANPSSNAPARVAVPLVDFPGVNVPPPPGANLAAWNWPPPPRLHAGAAVADAASIDRVAVGSV